MKKIKTIAAAQALLGVAAGLPAVASAQQLVPPAPVERNLPEVADLETSKMAPLGPVKMRHSLATAIASIAPSTASAGKVAERRVLERSALNINSGSANALADNVSTARPKEVSFPERTSKIAAHGSLAEAVPALSRTQLAAEPSVEHAIRHAPFSIDSITN